MSAHRAARRSRWLLPSELSTTAALGIGLYLLLRMEFVWVLGGLTAGWLATALFRRARRPHAPNVATRKTGQVLVGVALGPVLAAQSTRDVVPYLGHLLGAVLIALVGALAVARAYARASGVDGLTAGLATMPGGIGIMASVAAELGSAPSLVALVQGIRITVVVSAVPAILFLGGAPATRGSTPSEVLPDSPVGYAAWFGLTITAFGAASLASRLRVPVPSLLGPMIFGILAAFATRIVTGDAQLVQLPYLHAVVGQGLLGITVGEYLAQDVRVPRRAVAGGIAGVAATMAISLSTALLLTLLSPWSFLTCVLMTAPGGAPEMIVLAAATPSEVHLVVITQLIRQMAVNMLMPVWIRIFGSFPSPG